MDLSNIKRDPAAIEAGIWVGDIPGMEGLRLRVRGISSKTYRATMARLSRAIPKLDRERDSQLKPEAAMRVSGDAAAADLLLEWSGLEDDGKPLPYDDATAKKLLTDPNFEPLLDAVIWAASVVDNECTGILEGQAKNSPPPSAGTSKKTQQAAE